ncbi:hypothetical protein H180DRAFT_00750 [Streptomyces sp. WMMB 322]|nr:hypothetical protein H180DRAFT_00750 [Streptomyces sp. WMMB 322]
MMFSMAAEAASLEVTAASGEFVYSQVTLTVLLIVFAAFAAFALVLVSRGARQGGASAAGSTPENSTHGWTVAGVIVSVIALVITAIQLLHGW